MKNRCLMGLWLAGCLAAPLMAQMPEGYLDIDIAQVKMGRRGEFDSVNRRMFDIVRKAKTEENWLAYEVLYGQSNLVYFVSQRPSYAAAEQGYKAWEGALTKALGIAGMQKINDAWDATVEKEQTVFRRRRWDLTASAPANPAAYARTIGQARYIRSTTIHVRPGRISQYEGWLKTTKEAQERANSGISFFVSQDVAGGPAGVFHISALVKSLADLDEIKPLAQVLGVSYLEFERNAVDMIADTEVIVGRFLPELSNPAEDVVAADPKFWHPEPPPQAKPASPDKWLGH